MGRRLTVEIVGDSRNLQRSLHKATGAFRGTVGQWVKGAVVFEGVQKAMEGLSEVVHTGIDEFNQHQKVAAQTEAVLKSTGHAAGITAKHVDELALSIMNKTGIDDEAVASSENLLLGFKNIRNEAGKGNAVFDRATKVIQDYSVRTGKSATMASIAFGKALNDPVKGMGALGRAGIVLTDKQKALIKGWVKHGDTLKAQRFLLANLEGRFKGAAEAAGSTLAGQIEILRQKFENWAGDMVAKIVPLLLRFSKWINAEAIPAISRFWQAIRGTLSKAVHEVADVFMNDLVPAGQEVVKVFMNDLVPAGQQVVQKLGQLFDFLKKHQTVVEDIAIVVGTMVAAWIAYSAVMTGVRAVTAAVTAAQILLDAALAANPIGIVVLALAALVGGMIVAYRHSEEFRRIVNKTWADLKIGFHYFVDDIIPVLKRVFATVAGIIKPYLDTLRKVIDVVLDLIHGDWRKAWNDLKTLVVDILKQLPQTMWNALRALSPYLLAMGKWAGGEIVAGLKALPGLAVAEIKLLPGQIFAAAKLYATTYLKVGTFIVEKIIQGLKDLGGKVMDAIINAATAVYNAGVALGGEIVRGILDGLASLPGKVKDAIVGGLSSAVGLAGSVLHGSGPFQFTNHMIGEPMAEGIAQGIRNGSLKITQALADSVSAAVDRIKTMAQNQVGNLNTWLSQAFSARQDAAMARLDARAKKAQDKLTADLKAGQDKIDAFFAKKNAALDEQGKVLTPAEKALQEGQAAHEKASVYQAVTDAAAQLAAAQQGGDPAAIAAAQKDLDEAKYNQWVYDTTQLANAQRAAADADLAEKKKQLDEQQAAQQAAYDTSAAKQQAQLDADTARQQKALENQQWIEQQHFQTRFAKLEAYLESGHATAKKAREKIQNFLQDFGIGIGASGELLGKAFSSGLRGMIPDIVAAAQELTTALQNEGIIMEGRKVTITIEEKAKKHKKKRKMGGPVVDQEPYTVGESGPETFIPNQPGVIIPTPIAVSRQLASISPGPPAAIVKSTIGGEKSFKDGLYGELRSLERKRGRWFLADDFNHARLPFRLKLDNWFDDHVGYGASRAKIEDAKKWWHENGKYVIENSRIFDHGGWLAPHSTTLATNNTNKWEPVGPPGRSGGNTFVFTNYVGDKTDLMRAVNEGTRDIERNGGRLGGFRVRPGF